MELVAVLGPFLAIGLFWAMIWRVTRPLRRSRTNDPQKTLLGRFGLPFGSNLAPEAALIAGAGANRQAPMSLGEHILRPTFGLRALSLLGTPLLLFFLWFGDPAYFPLGETAKLATSALVLYAAINIATYELRFDRTVLIARGWAFNRREHRWSDLVRIRDNGHYLYVLNFADGSKLQIQKYLVGIPQFLATAHQHIEANLKGEQIPQPKIRPGGSIFGDRKTFH